MAESNSKLEKTA